MIHDYSFLLVCILLFVIIGESLFSVRNICYRLTRAEAIQAKIIRHLDFEEIPQEEESIADAEKHRYETVSS